MAETITNRGAFRIANAWTAGASAVDLRCLVFTGTQTGVHDKDLNFVADLDAVTGVSIHTERLTVAGEGSSEDDVNDRGLIDSNDLTFAAAPGVTAQGVAFYEEAGGTDATRVLISIHTTGFPQPMDGGLSVPTPNGLIRATPA